MRSADRQVSLRHSWSLCNLASLFGREAERCLKGTERSTGSTSRGDQYPIGYPTSDLGYHLLCCLCCVCALLVRARRLSAVDFLGSAKCKCNSSPTNKTGRIILFYKVEADSRSSSHTTICRSTHFLQAVNLMKLPVDKCLSA